MLFKDVPHGGKFVSGGELHVKLQEETDEGWNCCEISSGYLGAIQPSVEVEQEKEHA